MFLARISLCVQLYQSSCVVRPMSRVPARRPANSCVQLPLTAERLKPPSERDLEIYKRVHIRHHLHRNWLLAGGAVSDPQLRDFTARQRLSWATHKLRLVRALELASYACEFRNKEIMTTRRRFKGQTEVWREETTREPPAFDLKGVGLLVRISEALTRLEEQEELTDQPETAGIQNLLPAIFELLCRWRTQAEAEGRIEATPDVEAVVAGELGNLLGTSPADITSATAQAATHEALNVSAEPVNSADATTSASETSDKPADATSEENPQCERSTSPAAEQSSEQLLDHGPVVDGGNRASGMIGEVDRGIDSQ